MTVLILIILVLVIVVAIKDQDKDAKIAEVDKKSESILKRQKSGLPLGTARFLIQILLCIKFSSGKYPKVVSVYSTGQASKTQKSSMGEYEIVPGLTVRAFQTHHSRFCNHVSLDGYTIYIEK